MSFFKKLLNGPELSPEELAEKERIKEEKRIQREAAAIERKESNDAIKIAEQLRIEKFFGPNPGFTMKMNFITYRASFDYIENLISSSEEILSTLIVEFDKTEKREMKGVLVATTQKLIFASIFPRKEYNETFEYKKINGISLKNDGFSKREIVIDYGRSTRKFDDIVVGKELDAFLNRVREQITLHKSGSITSTRSINNPVKHVDKYEQLEKLGRLKEQGILSEEEFQLEKIKILNG